MGELTVGHGGKDDNWQSVDEDVVEQASVDQLERVIFSEVRELSHQCTVWFPHHMVVQIAWNVEDDAECDHDEHLTRSFHTASVRHMAEYVCQCNTV